MYDLEMEVIILPLPFLNEEECRKNSGAKDDSGKNTNNG